MKLFNLSDPDYDFWLVCGESGRLVWGQTTVLWFENQKGQILQKLTTSLCKNQTTTAFGNTYCMSLRCSKPLNLILIFGPNKFSFVWHNRERENFWVCGCTSLLTFPEDVSKCCRHLLCSWIWRLRKCLWGRSETLNFSFELVSQTLEHRDHLCLLAHIGTNAVFSTEVLLEKCPALWSHIKRLQHCSQTRRTQPLYCSLFFFFFFNFF